MKIFELFNPDKFKDEEFDIKDDLMFLRTDNAFFDILQERSHV